MKREASFRPATPGLSEVERYEIFGRNCSYVLLFILVSVILNLFLEDQLNG